MWKGGYVYIWNDCVMYGDLVYVFAHLWNVSYMDVLANFTCTVNMNNIVLLRKVWSCLYQSMYGDFPPNFK